MNEDVEQPEFVLPENQIRLKWQDAQQSNMMAAIAIIEIIKTPWSPKDKQGAC